MAARTVKKATKKATKKAPARAKASRTPGRAKPVRPSAPRGRDLALLIASSSELASSLDLAEVLTTISEKLLEVVPAFRAGIVLSDPLAHGGALRLAAGSVRGSKPAAFPRGLALDIARYPEVERAMTTRQPVVIEDVRESALTREHRAALGRAGVRALHVVPLMVADACIGVLSLGLRAGDPPLDARERALVQAVASQAAIAIRNAQLFAELNAGTRELEAKVAERTVRLRESHLRLQVLNDIAAAMNMSLDLDRILAAALGGLERLEGTARAQACLASSPDAAVYRAYELRSGRLVSVERALPAGEGAAALLSGGNRFVDVTGEAFSRGEHLQAPLVSKDGVVGAVQIVTREGRANADGDHEMLQQVAGDISIALERADLYRAAQRRSAQFEAISDIGRQLTGAVTLDDVLPFAATLIRNAFEHELVCVFTHDREAGELVVAGAAAARPEIAARVVGHRQSDALGLCGLALRERRAVNVPDVSKEESFIAVEGLATRSELIMPIMIAGQPAGLIDIQSRSVGAFTDNDTAVVRTLADQLAAALQLAGLISDLQRGRAFTDQIINNLTAGLIVTDRKRTVQVINSRACEILKVGREEIEGSDLLSMFPTAAPLFQYSYESIGRDCEVSLRDGTQIPLGFSNAFFVDTAQKRHAVIITFRDLSDVRDLQRKVRHAERLATIGTVAAGVAHEIRNPLFGISATAQILARDLPADSPLRALCSDMLDETRRLNDLVTNLVQYGRPQELKPRAVDPCVLVDEALEGLKPRATEAGIRVVHACPSDGRTVSADPDQLKQVLLNLVLNGIEATSKGGAITVTVDWHARGGWVVIGVRDEGPGLPAAEAERIFDLFYTTKPNGSGMGLAISTRIVQDHGGILSATSAPRGGGALFEVKLPLRDEQEA